MLYFRNKVLFRQDFNEKLKGNKIFEDYYALFFIFSFFCSFIWVFNKNIFEVTFYSFLGIVTNNSLLSFVN